MLREVSGHILHNGEIVSATNPLPVTGGGGGGGGGDASAANQLLGNTILTNILNELKDDVGISETIWRDSVTNVFYVRETLVNQDTGVITVTWKTPAGVAASPTISNLGLAIANKDIEISQITYRAIIAGTGYSIGDILTFVALIDTSTSTATSMWINGATREVLASAPLASTLEAFGATDGADATGVTQLSSGSGIRGWLSGIYKRLTDALTQATAPFSRLSDGTNTNTIKAASTASIATDTALVVALSPNSNTVKTALSDVVIDSATTYALTNVPTVIKATAGKIYGYSFINQNTTPVFIKFYDSAAPIVGTTIPVKLLAIPSNGVLSIENTSVIQHNFTTAISIAAVTGLEVSSTVAATVSLFAEIHYI